MPNYYVNKRAQSNGDHEVHVFGCRYLPAKHNRVYLGNFMTCRGAVQTAKKKYPKADGCAICSPACHTS